MRTQGKAALPRNHRNKHQVNRSHFRTNTLPLLLLVLVTLAAYVNAWPDSLTFDDKAFAASERFSGLSLSDILGFFTEDLWAASGASTGLYRPLLLVTIAMDAYFYGSWAAGYHLSNILLHLLVTLLVFGFIRHLLLVSGGQSPLSDHIAILTAAVFGVHPIHTEVVNSIFNRSGMLVSLGVIGGLWWFLRNLETQPLKAWGGLATIYLLVLFSKESGAILPALAVAMLWIFTPGTWRCHLRKSIPVLWLLIPLGIYVGLRANALDAPSLLDALDVPTLTDARDAPGPPDVLKVPGVSDALDVNGLSDARDVSGLPDARDAPGPPDVLKVPGVSDALDVNGLSDARDVSGLPDARDAPGAPDAAGTPETKQITSVVDSRSYFDWEPLLSMVDSILYFRWDRLLLATRVWFESLKIIVWPHPLQLYHSGYSTEAWIAQVLQLALVIMAIVGFRQKRYGLIAGLAFFYIAVLPASRIIGTTGGNPHLAERYIYLASVGLAIALAFGLKWLAQRFNLRTAIAPVLMALVILTPITWARNAEWASDVLLYESDYRQGNQRGEILYLLVGAHVREKNYSRATEICDKHAGEMKKMAQFSNRCGLAYGQIGRFDDAEHSFLLALKKQKLVASIHTNLASMYLHLGRRSDAQKHFELAVTTEEYPAGREYRKSYMLMKLYPSDRAKLLEAKTHLEHALQLQPQFVSAHQLLQQLNNLLGSI